MFAQVLNRRQARWSIIILLQLYDHVSPWFPTRSIDVLSKRSYLAPKEGDIAYDQ
jgi:hypothetical protein